MRRPVVASFALAALTAPVAAQTTTTGCATATSVACNSLSDVFSSLSSQLGGAIAGGSHTLGLGTTLGGFPHFAVAGRVNAVFSKLPDPRNATVAGATSTAAKLAANGELIALPTLDAAVGIFEGIKLGVTKVGGVDVLASATYVPNLDISSLKVTPSAQYQLGYGVRIGLLEQSLLVPGVAVSILKRDLPSMDVAVKAKDASLSLTNYKVGTTSWRVAAQKNLLMLQAAVGFGQDTYDASARLGGTVGTLGSINANSKMTEKQNTLYGSLGLNLLLVKVVAEVGQTSGGDLNLLNPFDSNLTKKRYFASLGARFSL
ncbi:MAG: hypothetical protein ACKORK_11770 [Gemmatimonadota bacterium]